MSEVDETIQTLRSECEALGIKWHSRHSEEGLRKLIAEAEVGDPDPEPAPAPPAPTPSVPEGYVVVKITKWGAGKVSDGQGGHFERGAVVALPEKSAWQLDAKHYAEAD